MALLNKIKNIFFPPKPDWKIFQEEAYRNLKYQKSKEGKRDAEIRKQISEIESKYADDINPWNLY